MASTRKPIISNSNRVMRAIHAIAFIALIVAAAYASIASLSYAQPYGILLAACAIIIASLAAPAYIASTAGRPTSKMQRTTVNTTTSLIAMTIALLGIGAIQDVVNVSCTGIMGAQQTCFESWGFWLSFYLFTPPVLAVSAIALAIARFADKDTKK